MKELAPKDAEIEIKQIDKLMRQMEELMDSELESLGFFVQRKHTKKATINLPELYELINVWMASIWENQGQAPAQEANSNQDEAVEQDQNGEPNAKTTIEYDDLHIKEVEEEYYGSQPSIQQASPSRNQQSSPHKSSPDRNKKGKLTPSQTQDPN
jgi:NACalpha-BTF3-like transcription factor